MQIISCASYYGTGSSAVTDLFSEFENCKSAGDYEFRFIHDPDGIRDLEYNLIENNNRHNTSNAIKRYIKYAKLLNGNFLRKGYTRYMGNDFKRYTEEYINNITELKCNSWWHGDRIEKGRLFYFIDVIIFKIGWRIFKRGFSLCNLCNEKGFFSAINKELFYEQTKKYISNVVASLNKEQKDFIMVDQLLPPSNLNSYFNYFDENIRVIVVERDPRDIYLLENEIWRTKIIPVKNVCDFCQWYEITRRHRKKEVYNKDKVYFLQFEDLVYKYEETSKKLIDFVGIDSKKHIAPKSRMDPAISIKNTNLKDKYPKYRREVQYIEENLKEYLYDFPAAFYKTNNECCE